MTGTVLATLIRYDTKTNSTTFTDADMLVLVNLFKDEIAGLIQQVRPEIWNIIAYDNLVASSTRRRYAYPEDVMNRLIGLELKFTATGDYVLAKPISRKHYLDALQEDIIVDNFDNLAPRYIHQRKSFYILSGTIIAVTSGIKLTYDSFPADLANLTGSTDLSIDPSTTTHGFPREFHELLARRVSIAYKDRNGLSLNTREQRYSSNDIDKPGDLEVALKNFSYNNLDQSIIGELPGSNETGDDGFEQ